MENFTLSDIKIKNRIDIYHYVYHNPGSTKQSIAIALGVSLPTVTQHLQDLEAEELIEINGQISSGVGRKARAYFALPNAYFSIGVEILSNRIYIVVINLKGEKIAKEKYNLIFSSTPGYIIELKELITEFLKIHTIDPTKVLGLSIALQGLVNSDGTEVVYGKIMDLSHFDLKIIQKAFPFPCRLLHDGDCGATGELWLNSSLTDAIVIMLSEHLGGTIILNRTLYSGYSGKAATFEHMTLVPDGRKCYCGKYGCAESYCSISALLESGEDLDEFFMHREQGEIRYVEKWNSYLNYLAILINNLHMVIDHPVILCGLISDFMTSADIEALKQKVFDKSTFEDSTDYISKGKGSYDAISIGAALFHVQRFLTTLTPLDRCY